MNESIDFESQASFSPCGCYRWWLKRSVSKEKSCVIFVGLNPSRANSSFDDPTLKRLLSFCSSWGYGKLIVVNLFARIGCSPSIIRRCSAPIGKKNDQELVKRFYEWSDNPLCDLWLGWGNQGSWQNRNQRVMSLLETSVLNRASKHPLAFGPLVVGVTRKGHPCHPLYIPNKEVLRPFSLK